MLLDLTDFAVQEQPEDNLMVAISRPWYNCSYTMAAKPIKSLELHYTMIQFLIKSNIPGIFHGLAAMVYEPLYHAQEKATIKLSSGCSCKAKSVRSSNISRLF